MNAQSMVGLLAISLSPFAHPTPTWAVLGGNPGGVEVDHRPLAGAIETIAAPEYHVEELTTLDLVVREYVATNGSVFAVAWAGRRVPDLPVLLGAYFADYEAGAAAAASKRSPLRGVKRIETDELVVELGGHMGAVWGRAYLPGLLPPGLSNEAIK